MDLGVGLLQHHHPRLVGVLHITKRSHAAGIQTKEHTHMAHASPATLTWLQKGETRPKPHVRGEGALANEVQQASVGVPQHLAVAVDGTVLLVARDAVVHVHVAPLPLLEELQGVDALAAVGVGHEHPLHVPLLRGQHCWVRVRKVGGGVGEGQPLQTMHNPCTTKYVSAQSLSVTLCMVGGGAGIT